MEYRPLPHESKNEKVGVLGLSFGGIVPVREFLICSSGAPLGRNG